MLLLNLTVVNFGVFHGSHSFDLAPRTRENHRYNLTIFSGHNGAGKTTLFQSMALALHGVLVFGDKVETR